MVKLFVKKTASTQVKKGNFTVTREGHGARNESAADQRGAEQRQWQRRRERRAVQRRCTRQGRQGRAQQVWSPSFTFEENRVSQGVTRKNIQLMATVVPPVRCLQSTAGPRTREAAEPKHVRCWRPKKAGSFSARFRSLFLSIFYSQFRAARSMPFRAARTKTTTTTRGRSS